MAEKGLPAPKLPPMHKTTKTKATDQVMGKDPSEKNPPKQNPPLEPHVVVVPIDHAQNQVPPNPQNPPDTNPPPHIPNLPPLPNLPAHIPNPPPPTPLPGHIPNPPSQAADPMQPPNPPVHVLSPMQPPDPPVPVPNPMQPLNPPAQVPNQMLPEAPLAQVPQLNWSYFKPEFSGKPEEDVEAHLLRTNDWMEMHNFPEVAKVQRFCLTLTDEATLWYETLRPIEVDWTGLQEHFRQQYSKFGNTREQLFHVWRSFHYDENVETSDSYVNIIKQVAALLNYGQPQILELFKTHYPVNYIGFYFQLII